MFQTTIGSDAVVTEFGSDLNIVEFVHKDSVSRI
jgi:hypothetical protein